MTNEERQAKIEEIEEWLVGQIGEVRASALEEAAKIADEAREDAEGDVRVVRDRIRAAINE